MPYRPGMCPLLTLEVNKWAELIEYGEIKHYPKDCVIVDAGTCVDRLYYVLEGEVKYSLIGRNGNERILAIVGKGALFGEGPLFTKKPTTILAVAHTDCKICELNEKKVIELLKNYPILAIEIIKSLTYKIYIMTSQLEDLNFKCSKARIANLIYKLVMNFGEKLNSEFILTMNFTHDEMGSIAGCSRVSVSRVLSELKHEGIISYSRNHIAVKNIEALKEVASSTDNCE
ncbi:MAG: Crp/Fnr family transcriptional regulator [Thermoanaerobacteraceae bacterium]|nr:Crp/Fnr family transcriptional regulator [Thermoanaerobacteraceae bacterium]